MLKFLDRDSQLDYIESLGFYWRDAGSEFILSDKKNFIKKFPCLYDCYLWLKIQDKSNV